MANVRDDEVELPEDPEGEKKVDKNGNLKGNREYRVRTFLIEGKGERLYMLSTEPARCIGFRDSYLFFQKHPQRFKIILEEDAKKDLIERSLIRIPIRVEPSASSLLALSFVNSGRRSLSVARESLMTTKSQRPGLRGLWRVNTRFQKTTYRPLATSMTAIASSHGTAQAPYTIQERQVALR